MSKQKLLGIELFRGISTYAVILVHSGDENWGIYTDPEAIAFRLHFYFAVPFFLAAAFYFMTAKPAIAYSPKFWRSRVERILIPYTIWSTIFLLSRAIIFTFTHKPDRLQQLLQDPLAIFFFGGASYHLYFLNLLFTGTLLILLIPFLHQLKLSKYSLLLLSGLSIILYNFLETSGNSFQLGSDVAFQGLLSAWHVNSERYPLVRLILVEIAWMIKCLPYLLIALILNRLPQSTTFLHAKFTPIILAILVLGSNILGGFLCQGALQEVLLAYGLLLLSISLSSYLKNNTLGALVANVGACSFGIYLIHPFIMNIIKSLIGKILPELMTSVSIPLMLTLSIPCFLISWLVVASFHQHRPISKYLFGA